MKMRSISSLSTLFLRMNFTSHKKKKKKKIRENQENKKGRNNDLHAEGINLRLKMFSSQFIHWLLA